MIDDFFDGKVPGKNPKKMIKEMKAKGLISDDGGDDSQNEYGDETDIMLGSDASSFGEPELEVYYEKDENGNTVEKKRYVKKPKTIKRNKDGKPVDEHGNVIVEEDSDESYEVLDEDGNPVLDENGNVVKQYRKKKRVGGKHNLSLDFRRSTGGGNSAMGFSDGGDRSARGRHGASGRPDSANSKTFLGGDGD